VLFLRKVASKVFVVEVEGLGSASFLVLLHFLTSFLVVADPFLEKVSLSLEGNHFHPFEWILFVVVLGYAESKEKSIGYKPNVLRHQD